MDEQLIARMIDLHRIKELMNFGPVVPKITMSVLAIVGGRAG